MRYFIYFSYFGKNYHGWQVQPNAVSVQEVLSGALSTVLREEITLVGAGRTDTGVHARKMVAHFDTDNEIKEIQSRITNLNALLPADIAISDIKAVSDNMHARFSAKSRTYKYYITKRKNPFIQETAARFVFPIDVDAMNEAAKTLFDYSDFTSFSKLHTDTKTNICRIYKAKWETEDDDLLVFTIQADRFLRNMVRAIVGTLIEVGRKRLSIDEFRAIIEKKDRCSAGMSVPAHGLFLEDVEY